MLLAKLNLDIKERLIRIQESSLINLHEEGIGWKFIQKNKEL